MTRRTSGAGSQVLTFTTGAILPRPEVENLLCCSLPACPSAGLPAPDLDAVASRMRLAAEAWGRLAPFLIFHPRQYRRVRLFRDRDWEALLLCWLPGQGTTIHDHGGSVGLSLVVMGELEETRFTKAEAVADGPGLSLVERAACPSGVVSVERVDTIHRVANASPAPAASLHVYSPPLLTLGAYDEGRGRRWEVDVSGTPDVQVGGDATVSA